MIRIRYENYINKPYLKCRLDIPSIEFYSFVHHAIFTKVNILKRKDTYLYIEKILNIRTNLKPKPIIYTKDWSFCVKNNKIKHYIIKINNRFLNTFIKFCII